MAKKISSHKTVWTSFFVDLGDIILNVAVMTLTGSMTMLAEAFEGLSDLVASGLLLIGLRNSKRRRNKKHPFGYGKSLFFWTLVSAIVMLIFGAGLSLYFGVQRLLQPEPVERILLAYAALTISIGTNGYALSLSTRRLLDEEKLSALYRIFLKTTHVETKNTFILDLTGTLSAVLGMLSLIIYQVADIEYFDAIGALLIGILIAISSVMLIWGVKDYLVGKTAPPDVEKNIRDIVLMNTDVETILSLDTMYIGSERLLVLLDIRAKFVDIRGMDKLVGEIKKMVRKEIPEVYSIQVEVSK